MADKVLVNVSKAVIAALAAAPDGTFVLQFQPERSYADWAEPLTDEDNLHVDVVPLSALPSDLQARGAIVKSPGVDIVVREKFGETQQSESDGRIKLDAIDQLANLVEQLEEFFTAQRLAEYSDAVWKETKILAAYKPSHLRQYRQFTGIVRVTFEVSVSL